MRRFLGMLLLALSIGSLGPLLGQSSANASSQYDGLINTTDTMYIRSSQNTCDPSLVYIDPAGLDELFNNSDHWQVNPGEQDEYNNARLASINNQTGAYLVMIIRSSYNQPEGEHFIRVIYSPLGLSTTWTPSGVSINDPLNTSNALYQVDFYMRTNNGCIVQALSPARVSGAVIGSNLNITHPGNYQVVAMVGNVEENYPVDYSGELFPDSLPGSDFESKWQPDIKLHRGSDWEVELSDYNFFTFDNLPFTCGEHEYAPMIDWVIYDTTGSIEVVVDELYQNASSQVYFNAEKLSETKTYRIDATYTDCEGMTFTETSSVEFTVDPLGNLIEGQLMSDCKVFEAFTNPEFDYIACLENIGILANMLSFNTIKFSNSWVSSGNCSTLGTLGNWLNLSNKTVCPYFSNEVRNTITPFITFLLGLVMVKFIAGRGSHGTMRESV